ncbi:MAG: hypothetical protein DRI57_12690 [Deltaproteobacteria bacterium]|nr:MAG: hypothetical protein DRI57_12690 [Deltaproteobacteria bacterium]
MANFIFFCIFLLSDILHSAPISLHDFVTPFYLRIKQAIVILYYHSPNEHCLCRKKGAEGDFSGRVPRISSSSCSRSMLCVGMPSGRFRVRAG